MSANHANTRWRVVEVPGGFGYRDSFGKNDLMGPYRHASPFSQANAVARVQFAPGNDWGLIDTSGRVIFRGASLVRTPQKNHVWLRWGETRDGRHAIWERRHTDTGARAMGWRTGLLALIKMRCWNVFFSRTMLAMILILPPTTYLLINTVLHFDMSNPLSMITLIMLAYLALIVWFSLPLMWIFSIDQWWLQEVERYRKGDAQARRDLLFNSERGTLALARSLLAHNPQALAGNCLDDLSAPHARWQRCDLTRTSLQRANLASASLSRSQLFAANLTHASLQGARLNGATLTQAILKGTDLSKANLSRADAQGADFRGANLRDTNLRGTNFSDATLSDADFTDARYDENTQWPGPPPAGARAS